MREENTINVPRLMVTILVCVFLTLLPLPGLLVYARPAFLLLVVLYCVVFHPQQFSMIFAWFLGLLADLVTGAVMGQHALAFLVVAYLAQKGYQFLRHLFIFQQMVAVFLLSLLSLSVQYLLLVFLNDAVSGWYFWMSSITNMLAWPLIIFIFKRQTVGSPRSFPL